LVEALIVDKDKLRKERAMPGTERGNDISSPDDYGRANHESPPTPQDPPPASEGYEFPAGVSGTGMINEYHPEAESVYTTPLVPIPLPQMIMDARRKRYEEELARSREKERWTSGKLKDSTSTDYKSRQHVSNMKEQTRPYGSKDQPMEDIPDVISREDNENEAPASIPYRTTPPSALSPSPAAQTLDTIFKKPITPTADAAPTSHHEAQTQRMVKRKPRLSEEGSFKMEPKTGRLRGRPPGSSFNYHPSFARPHSSIRSQDNNDALAAPDRPSGKNLGTSAINTATLPQTPPTPLPVPKPHSDSRQSVVSRLNGYFTGRDTPRRLYSDADIHEISTLLKHHAPKWCKAPRTYIILRTIGSLDLLDRCIDVGFSDYWLPVTERNLPEFLRPSIRTAFTEAQTLVLTKSMDLEKGAKGQHCYFRTGETLPLETKGILGSGGYGQVDRVLSLISFKEYARKRVLRSAAFRGRRKEDVTQFIAEIEIMKRLRHCHVVEFVGSYTDAKYIGLIMTPIAEGDLTSYLASVTPAKYPELRTFFGCLATGLEFLHQRNVRHKDIKPGNILVNNSQVLFTDFGLSLDFTDASGSTTMSMVNGMTPRYCAPEVANCEPRNTMSDIWSLGIVFFEMLITLKGKKTEFMDEYFRTHGSGQAFVRFNISAMPAFVAELATLDSRVDDKPSEWIELMLLEDQKLRPTASALVNQITASMTAEGVFTFCGICCAWAEEEDFSDYASDYDG
jgi:hypothetical protein